MNGTNSVRFDVGSNIDQNYTNEITPPSSLSKNGRSAESPPRKQNIQFNGESPPEKRNIQFNGESPPEKQNIQFNGESPPKKWNTQLNDSNVNEKNVLDVHAPCSSKKSSFLMTLMNLVKGNLGTGVLALGIAFKSGGWLVSTVGLIVLAFILTYNQHRLVRLATVLEDQLKLNYFPTFVEAIELAFANGLPCFRPLSTFFRKLVMSCMIAVQMGFCCVYLLLISTFLIQICEFYNFDLDIHLAIFTVLPVIIATAMIRNLKYLAPLSLVANLSTIIGLIIIIYSSMSDLPPLSERVAVGNWTEYYIFLGIAIYAFEGINLLLPLHQGMKNKDKFNSSFGVINITMIFMLLISFLLGFVGYLKYGDDVKGSLTQNLPLSSPSTKVLIVCLTVGIIFTYAVQFYVPVMVLKPIIRKSLRLPISEKNQEYVTRLVLVIFTVLAAELIPRLDLFISLIGAVGASLLTLAIPSLAYMTNRKSDEYGFLCWRLIVDIFSVILGAVSLVLGAFFSLKAIIETFAHSFKLN